MKLNVISSLFLSAAIMVSAQAQEINRKSYRAVRVSEKPTIDGMPFEDIWLNANEATDFLILQPDNGQNAPKAKSTITKILYDDNALYVAGYLYDDNPSNIARQFSQRDQVDVQVDVFAIWINTYSNQIDQSRFYVTAAGAIGDSKASSGIEDFSYEVVFDAKISFDEKGWYIEMEIPYQALRFPDSDIQNWSFNILRRINNDNLTLTYNPIVLSQGNEAQYDANLLGISNIKPPLRLSLFPYTSARTVNSSNQFETDYSAGMDIKYGISEAFTLDATLVPDFGQVGFDELELNLGPFEQTFQEQRPFFTEGVELFQKGNIFFSRRIGGTPSGFSTVQNEISEDEVVINNPNESQLINAFKFTGRTKNKLGIGFLNATTGSSQASIRDTMNNTDRKFTTEPVTNYNVFVLDQQFSNNSSVYLTNANTIRRGTFTDANVTATGLTHFDKLNTYKFNVDFRLSNRFLGDRTNTGAYYSAGAQKIQGKWRYGISNRVIGEKYNPNDLGLNFINNLNSTYSFVSFNQFTPKGIFNNYSIALGVNHNRSNNPNQHLITSVNLNLNFQTKNLYSGGGFVTITSSEIDLFESRIENNPIRYKSKIIYGTYLTTDTRKNVSIGFNLNSEQRINDAERRVDFSIRPSWRVSDRLFFRYSFFRQNRWDRLSFVAVENSNSILSRRSTSTLEHSVQAVYNIDRTKAINLRLRNFWSSAQFLKDYKKLENGTVSNYNGDTDFQPDVDFNVWNLDVSYIWRFAPASDLTLLYRNSVSSSQSLSNYSYTESLDNLLDAPLQQTILLRLTYFFDLNRLIN